MRYVLVRPDKLQDEIFDELALSLGKGVHRLSQKRMGLSREPSARESSLCAAMGIALRPVCFEGTPEGAVSAHNPQHTSSVRGVKIPRACAESRANLPKVDNGLELYLLSSDRAVVLAEPANAEALARVGQPRNHYFGNVHLMSQLIFLHGRQFGQQPRAFVDLFLGHGGSLIAGYLLGCERIVGFEINYQNLSTAKGNLETFLEREGIPYEHRGSNDFHTYTLSREGGITNIDLVRENSMRLEEATFRDLGAHGTDIVTDIPWGCNQCFAVGAGGTIREQGSMGALYHDLERTIQASRAQRATIALNSAAGLQLPLARRREVTKLYHIAHYAPRP